MTPQPLGYQESNESLIERYICEDDVQSFNKWFANNYCMFFHLIHINYRRLNVLASGGNLHSDEVRPLVINEMYIRFRESLKKYDKTKGAITTFLYRDFSLFLNHHGRSNPAKLDRHSGSVYLEDGNYKSFVVQREGGPSPHHQVIYEEIREQVIEACNRVLNSQEQQVFADFVFNETKHAMIARELGVSRQRVSSIIRQSIAKIRKHLGIDLNLPLPQLRQ